MSGAEEQRLPRWQSHKEVLADKIVAVEDGNGPVLMRWRLACGILIDVGAALAARPAGRPVLGGYYVRYEDGFESWSPAEPFEAGYTRTAG